MPSDGTVTFHLLGVGFADGYDELKELIAEHTGLPNSKITITDDRPPRIRLEYELRPIPIDGPWFQVLDAVKRWDPDARIAMPPRK